MLAGRTIGRALQVVVGVADVLPKLVAYRLIEPAIQLEEPVRVVCRVTGLPSLLAALVTHRIDVVLSDAPIPSSLRIRGQRALEGVRPGGCAGLFPVPSIVEEEVGRQYRARPIGIVEGVAERFYAISVERRVTHPAVCAICTVARTKLFE